MTPKMNAIEEGVSKVSDLHNSENSVDELLQCVECGISFTDKTFLYSHLYHHIKQPQVTLTRVQLPPLKLTFKNKSNNSFEIINSPTSGSDIFPFNREETEDTLADKDEERGDDDANVNLSPNFAEVNLPEVTSPDGPQIEEIVDDDGDGGIPGAEPTPPPEPSPDYPKIRIKTSGLLKEPLTITEITEEEEVNSKKDSWSSSLEDPLKLPGNDDILSLFNNNERAKDFGFTTSDSEFMPLDRLGETNSSNALQLYNQNSINPSLNGLAGLPMEALAQQVSRLQPSGNGMHQQNVLINIQQFPQAPPPPPPYHPASMYHHPPQPMYHQPYPSYQPPNPMYYPPASGYMPPPQPQIPPPMPQPPPPIRQPPVSQPNQPYQSIAAPPRPQGPPTRPIPPQRMPMGPRQPIPTHRQPLPRQRPPLMRPRSATITGGTAVRSVRPRMPVIPNGVRQQGIKRSPEQIQALQAKKKRLDVLTPDKDDEDCQVICMQPKNTDGGLPQISSVQGGTPEPSENSVMHLSDSITLSVRNPQMRAQSPKKSDAKAVANILATRGITVTATPKPKEKTSDAQKAALPSQLNLNSAVSIIPSATGKTPNKSSNSESHLPTVDLTDDTTSAAKPVQNQAAKSPQRPGLPFKCDLCPAQYPNAVSLSKHRQNYHKTSSGMCEIGVPLINLKQPGIFQKLSTLGIFNYIPLPASGPDGMFALPIINGRSPGNVAAMGTTSMLTLGPVRNIPRPTVNGTNKLVQQQNNK